MSNYIIFITSVCDFRRICSRQLSGRKACSLCTQHSGAPPQIERERGFTLPGAGFRVKQADVKESGLAGHVSEDVRLDLHFPLESCNDETRLRNWGEK